MGDSMPAEPSGDDGKGLTQSLQGCFKGYDFAWWEFIGQTGSGVLNVPKMAVKQICGTRNF